MPTRTEIDRVLRESCETAENLGVDAATVALYRAFMALWVRPSSRCRARGCQQCACWQYGAGQASNIGVRAQSKNLAIEAVDTSWQVVFHNGFITVFAGTYPSVYTLDGVAEAVARVLRGRIVMPDEANTLLSQLE